MPWGEGKELQLTSTPHLSLARCPHCNTANPTISRVHQFGFQPMKKEFAAQVAGKQINWHVYVCASCAGLIGAGSLPEPGQIFQVPEQIYWIVPNPKSISLDIPKSAARYLGQARETLASPAASVMMSASAVDAMLKERGYKDGKLYSRIQKAEQDGVLTSHMADWAHDIRLDANDERHADEAAIDMTAGDATRCLEFADALADLLFVLPARVKRGRKSNG